VGRGVPPEDDAVGDLVKQTESFVPGLDGCHGMCGGKLCYVQGAVQKDQTSIMWDGMALMLLGAVAHDGMLRGARQEVEFSAAGRHSIPRMQPEGGSQ
jgi:hypothetical protein